MKRPKKRFGQLRLLVAALLGAAIIAACGPASPSGVGDVTGVAISPDTATVAVGESTTLSATVTGSGAFSRDVTWSSSDTDVATVSSAGVVTGVSEGTATITATSRTDSSVRDTATVTVVSGAPTIVEFEGEPLTIEVGESTTLGWSIAGAYDTAVITAGDTEVAADLEATGTLEVTPGATTTYTLTLDNDAGDTATAEVTITVREPGATGPAITLFTASPLTIDEGGSATLSWAIDGDFASAAITAGGATVLDVTAATGTHSVSPTEDTTYTLTVTPAAGDAAVATVDVMVRAGTTPPPPPPPPPGSGDIEITGFDATMAMRSQMELTYTVTGATDIAVYGVNGSGATVLIADGLPVDGATVALPPSTHQTIRLVARDGDDETSVQHDPLPNVVTSTADYDLYASQGWTAETPIPGTLRYVVNSAAPGSIIGFASDIPEIELTGVEVRSGLDAHLFIAEDLIISAPDGFVLRGLSGYDPADGDPDDGAGGYTYRSRMIQVAAGANAHIDNMTITGGNFIFYGAGIHNLGTLRLTNSVVTENRAWSQGGGVYNGTGATMIIEDSEITNNVAAVTDDEFGSNYEIRGGYVIPRNGDVIVPFGSDGYGGGIYNHGTLTIRNSTVSGNHARESSGGIGNGATGTLTLENVQILNNEANRTAYTGGAGWSVGAGVSNEGDLTVTGSTFTGNVAQDQGGGFYLDSDGTASLTTAVFNNNVADEGGAILHSYCTDPSNLSLTSVTYNGNDSRNAGVLDDLVAYDCDAPTDALGTASTRRAAPADFRFPPAPAPGTPDR